MLDITMRCLQVCWEEKFACFILFVFFFFYFVYKEGDLGLKAQLHLSWSRRTHSNIGVAA